MLSVPHLDREFDYLVVAEQSDDAQPGVRVRVRFHGRLVDAFVLERRSDTDHVGKLGWLDRVVSRRAGADARRAAARRRRRRALRGHPRRRAAAGRPAAARQRRKARHPPSPHRLPSSPSDAASVGRIRPRRAVPRRTARGPCRPRGLAGVARGAVGRPAGRGRGGHRRTPAAACWRSCPTSATSTRCTPAPSGSSTKSRVVALVGRARPRTALPALAVGAARRRARGHRNPQRRVRAGRRPRAGAWCGTTATTPSPNPARRIRTPARWRCCAPTNCAARR